MSHFLGSHSTVPLTSWMVQSRNDSSINIKIKDQNICEEGFDVKPVESNELKFTKSLKTFGNS